MEEKKFNGTVDALMKGMSNVLTTKTVVGDAVTVGDIIILPLVDVSFGMGAGSRDGSGKETAQGGMGMKMSPSAVLVIHNGHTKLVNIKNQDTVTKILDMVPDLVDRFKDKGQKQDDIGVTDQEAVDAVISASEEK